MSAMTDDAPISRSVRPPAKAKITRSKSVLGPSLKLVFKDGSIFTSRYFE